ncbi:MAG: bifunctional diaminohydroxyphosphoribosylaminopyrimidine deaminase/5-amino-6-(5-phosphoribosylamino)uracil reductase RibD [Candidatus Omnitrophica bacterium]|nr:bifunctional diaminohydroxyphosphoribosylaminopyrimidine deaminase/5-amino-6-(5-phosphoribosylamino)uracil reductase RibD [Candidatus Omnitrophota bacterium]
MNDIDYMNLAYRLALKARGRTSPNPLVGCVIVRGKTIIAEGWHRRCGADHAEVVALKKAGRRSRGARMYVTLEPCYHYGRTPPCVDAVIESGIKEVMIGMKDPNPFTNGKSIAKLRRAGIKTRVGILQKELRAMNEAFIKYATKKMPFVAVKSAQSLDGKIATAKGDSQWITSLAARKYARRLRDDFDAIMVGINTVLKDNPRLNGAKKTKGLKKIVIDSLLKIPTKSLLFSGTNPSDIILATTAKASLKKRLAFQKRGVRVMVAPQSEGKVDLKWLFKQLAKNEVTSILAEGGAQTIGSVLKEKLADKIFCYVAPVILGDDKALASVVGFNIEKISQAVPLKNIVSEKIGHDILIQGYFDC